MSGYDEFCDECGKRLDVSDDEWISVEDRLPEDDQLVDVYAFEGKDDEGCRYASCKFTWLPCEDDDCAEEDGAELRHTHWSFIMEEGDGDDVREWRDNPTHWRPIPDPPHTECTCSEINARHCPEHNEVK